MGALVSRRKFMIASLATGAILATAGFAVRLAPAAPGAWVLSTHEIGICDAIAEVLFPGDPFPVNGREAQVGLRVDREVATLLPPTQLAAFRYLLRAVELGTEASRGVRFTRLSAADRLDVLDTWADPRVLPRRVSFDVLKVFLGMAYFRHPAVIETIGWRAECGGRRT